MKMSLMSNLGLLILLIYRYCVVPIVRSIFSLKNTMTPVVKVPPVDGKSIMVISALELAKKIKSRDLRAVDVMRAYIERTQEVNPVINAVVHERYSDALKEAQELDDQLDLDPDHFNLEKYIFLGVPFTVKVAFGVKGCPNSAGLVIRRDVLATEDAVVVSRMRAVGAIPLCLSNVSELCMWWESANKLYGRTSNPYDNRRIVGGSSGGEGALVGAGASVIGVGSDIGGSIRMPCFFNGVFGHKATAGMISNEGQFPNADGGAREFMLSGPIVRYVEDLLPSVKVMAGVENSKVLHLDLKVDVKSLTFFYMEDIGDDYFTVPVQEDIRSKLRQVVSYYRDLGCSVKPLRLSYIDRAFQIWSAKMSMSKQTRFCRLMGDYKFDINPYLEVAKKFLGLSDHTVPALLLAVAERLSSVTQKENHRLLDACEKLSAQLSSALAGNSCLLLPTHPTSALFHNEPLVVGANFAYTAIFNVLGVPATAVPLGLDQSGLPVGIQVIARKFEDKITLAVAKDIGNQFGGWTPP